jgi:hypothetical protein
MLFFKCNPFDLRMENTEAESVDDMVEANKKAVVRLKPTDT